MSAKFIDNFYSLQLTEDHLSSQYFVSIDFSNVKKLDSILQTLGTSYFIIKQEGDFQVPSLKVPNKTMYYKGRTYHKRVPRDNSEKKFDITFRLDRYAILYKLLNKIYKFSYDYTKGSRESKSTNLAQKIVSLIKSDLEYRMNIKVYYSSLGEVTVNNPLLYATNYFFFEGCQIEDISLDSFNHSSGDPTKVKVSFVYDYFEPVIMETQKKRDTVTL